MCDGSLILVAKPGVSREKVQAIAEEITAISGVPVEIQFLPIPKDEVMEPETSASVHFTPECDDLDGDWDDWTSR